MNLHLAEIACSHRAQCPCRPDRRPSGLAHVQAPCRSTQHHDSFIPPKCPELNPVENIWQFMRDELALEPRLQIPRRSPRSLLCGLEQAHRSTVAHHVHRIAPIGPWVLINGIWYKSYLRRDSFYSSAPNLVRVPRPPVLQSPKVGFLRKTDTMLPFEYSMP